MPAENSQHRLLIVAIMVAVLGWGLFHAVGAMRLNGNPWRAVVVLACVAGYVAAWAGLLANRRRRLAGRNGLDSDDV